MYIKFIDKMHNQPMSLFSKNLRFLRKQRQLNQDEISILFNKRANTVGNWENGKSEPNLSELVRLGDFFNISLHELMHSDLDIEKVRTAPQMTGVVAKKPVEYQMQEPSEHVANDEGGHFSGLILGELKAVHEKLDKLISILSSAGVRNPVDKSNH
jgi:transcriptional regulator with XRE-family HTH domain